MITIEATKCTTITIPLEGRIAIMDVQTSIVGPLHEGRGWDIGIDVEKNLLGINLTDGDRVEECLTDLLERMEELDNKDAFASAVEIDHQDARQWCKDRIQELRARLDGFRGEIQGREGSYVLAALRAFQASEGYNTTFGGQQLSSIHDIESDGGTHEPMTPLEVSNLIRGIVGGSLLIDGEGLEQNEEEAIIVALRLYLASESFTKTGPILDKDIEAAYAGIDADVEELTSNVDIDNLCESINCGTVTVEP